MSQSTPSNALDNTPLAVDSPLTASILASFLLPIAHGLRQYGVEPMSLFEACGLDPATVINPDRRVPAPLLHEILRRCEAETGDEAFALVAAEQLRPQMLASLGLAWLASDTVYDGLHRMVRFSGFTNNNLRLRLEEKGEFVCLYSGIHRRPENYSPLVADYGWGIVLRMSRLTLGEYLSPVSVALDRPTPREPERWESALSARVSFAATEASMQFALSDINEPLLTGDPALARVNDEHTERYMQRFAAKALSSRVLEAIVEKLPDGPPSQGDIAQRLLLSERTLQRRLQEEGNSYSTLLQNAREQLARSYLQHPEKSVLEIAYQLGFSEPSTFSRAFKRWTGSSPLAFREQVLAQRAGAG